LTAVQSVEQPDLYWTYEQLNARANQVAHWALSHQFRPGQVVAFLSENRIDYPAVTIGLAKVGVAVALINFNLSGKLLQHAIQVASSVCVITSERQLAQLETLKQVTPPYQPPIVHVLPSLTPSPSDPLPKILWMDLASHSTTNPEKSYRKNVQPRDPFVYIYTSGTTGPSKAAKFSHRRWIGCGLTWSRPAGIQPSESYYIALPLYHGYVSNLFKIRL
jgi:fatty-acyl-CoA synthase